MTPLRPVQSLTQATGGQAAPAPEVIRSAIAGQRSFVEQLFAQLAQGSAGEPGIMRDTYGAGENFAHDLIADLGRARGLHVGVDAALNTFVTWPGSAPDAPRILIGSHLDSVPHGGNFDGAAGVVAGLAVIAALEGLGLAPKCDITVMGIRAEESVWFQVSYIGSRSALGSLPDGALDARRIDTGRTLASHIAACGGDPEALLKRRVSLDPRTLRAFLEVHIEQAPSLVESGLPIAICTGIPGNFRYPDARVRGRHDHVGTPRRFRRDAAMAAADLAMALDRLWEAKEREGVPLAITFGRFHTDAAMHGMTTVPGEFAFSLDVRAYDADVLTRIEQDMMTMIGEIEARRHVSFDLGRRACAAVGKMDASIADDLEQAAHDLDIATMRLGSPASHDGAAFAEAGVPVAMLFVRNANGSHNPDEHMDIDDFLDACMVLARWVAGHMT